MSGWRKTPLSKVASLTMGQSPDSRYYNSENIGLPFLQGCAEFGVRHPFTEAYCSSGNKVGRANSILFSVRAPVGKINIADRDYIIGRGLASIEGYDANQSYMEQYLVFIAPEFRNASQGSTFEAINSKELNAWLISLPESKAEQAKIAEVLSTVDRAIEQTEALIAKQQRIKAGLLQDLLTRGIDEHGNLRSEATHTFKDSPLGRIPVEWEVSKFSDILEQPPKNGYSPVESDSWHGTYMLGLGCLTVDGFQPIQLKFAPSATPQIEAALLKHGDFLISRSNTPLLVGLVGLFQDIGEPCIYPDLMVRLRFTEAVTGQFMEQVCVSEGIRRQIASFATGTSSSMVKISGAIIRNFLFRRPPRDEQTRIMSIIAGSRSTISVMQTELEKLRSLKTALMQDLLTGRKRVTPLLDGTREEIATAA